MAGIEKTVFISYRRMDVFIALAVYEKLKTKGYDVFFDYKSIPSGDFEHIIVSNIKARAHFLLILTPPALDRCDEPDDWLRREIEIAIDEKRNIVPLFFKGFQFGDASVAKKLTGKLKNLGRYNGLNVPEDYFDAAISKLRTQYLKAPLDTILHPVSTEVQEAVKADQVAADKDLAKIEDVNQLIKRGPSLLERLREVFLRLKRWISNSSKLKKSLSRGTVGIVLILLLVMASVPFISSRAFIRSTPTQSPTPTRTATWTPTLTITPSASETNSPTPTLTRTRTATPTLTETQTPTSTRTLAPPVTPTKKKPDDPDPPLPG
jgi:hypothetical protein